jgi:PAS domain S-box-containing protein
MRVVVGLFLVSLLVCTFGYRQYKSVEAEAELQASQEMNAIGDLKAFQIENWIRERRADGKAAASNPLISKAVDDFMAAPDSSPQREQINGWLEGLFKAYGYSCVALYDSGGRLVLGYSKNGFPEGALISAYVQKALKGGNQLITEMHKDQKTEQIHLDMLQPIGRQDPPKAILLLQSEMKDFLYPLLTRWPSSSKTGESILLKRAGGELQLLSEPKFLTNAALKLMQTGSSDSREVFAIASGGKTGMIQGIDYRGVEVLGAIRPIAGMDWILITKLDHQEVDAQVQVKGFQVALLGLSTLISLCFLAAWWWRQQQVQALKKDLAGMEQLRLKDVRFQAYLEQASDAIYVHDFAGRFTEVNRQACVMLGYDRAELLRLRLDEVEVAFKLAEAQNVLAALKPGESIMVEGVHRRKDGTILPVEVRLGICEPSEDRLYISSVRDISERKKHAEMLRLRSERFEALLESAPVAMIILDEKANIISSNAKFLELFGYSREELGTWEKWWLKTAPQQSYRECLCKEWHTLIGSTEESANRGRQIECRVQCKDGGIRVVYIIASRLGGDTLVNFIDITERKLAEELLRNSETRFRTIIEASPVPFGLVDERGNITYFNSAFTSTYGYTIADTPNLEAWWPKAYPEEKYREEILKTWSRMLEQANASGTGVTPVEVIVRCKNGVSKPVSAYAVPVGQVLEGAILVVMQDISLSKQREAELSFEAQLNKALLEIPTRAETLDEKGLTELGLLRMEELTGSGLSFIRFSDDRSSDLETLIWSRRTLEQFGEIKLGEDESSIRLAAWSKASHDNRIVVSNDDDQPGECLVSACGGIKRSIKMPVMQAGQMVLLAGVGGKKTDYNDRDVKAVQLIAESLWQIILRRRSQAKLQKFSLAIEQSPSSVVITDLDGNIEYVNPRLTEVTGYRMEDVIGKTPRIFKSAKTPPEIHEQIWRTITAGNTWRGELVNQKKSGEQHVEIVVVTPVRDAAGKASHYIAVKEDITNLRKIEARISEGEIQHKHILRSAMDGFWLADSRGRILEMNDAYCRMSGFTSEEGLRMGIGDFEAFEDAEATAGHMHKIITSGADRFVSRHRRKDGSQFDVEVSVNYLPVGGGQFACFLRDITEQLAANAKLALQSAALESAANSIMITTPEGEIEWVNEAFVQISGYKREEVIGKTPRILNSGEHDAEFFSGLWRTIKSGKVWKGEIVNRCKAGNLVEEEVTITPLSGEDRAIKHFIAIKQDITERKALERQFLRAQRLEGVGLLAAGISHDLNNVLAPILMSVELMRYEQLPPGVDRILENVENSAKRGAEIVRQVLTFARGVEGKKGPVQVRHLIKEMVRMLEETFPRNLTITSRLREEPKLINGDATQLHQVLLNLAVNARDAMPTGGQLSFTAYNQTLKAVKTTSTAELPPGDYVVIEVADTGSGMTDKVMDHMFDPFFTTKEHGKGTGLGLATVMGIVKSHKGGIEVSSKLGFGTVFKLYFPAVETDVDSNADMMPAEHPKGRGELIMVVDDEAVIVKTTEALLQHYGYRTLGAHGGVEALSLFINNQKDVSLVLTDAMMPLIDGLALIGQLKKLNPKIKCILASGMLRVNDQLQLDEFEAYGISQFLQKPYTAEVLLEAIAKELHAPTGT